MPRKTKYMTPIEQRIDELENELINHKIIFDFLKGASEHNGKPITDKITCLDDFVGALYLDYGYMEVSTTLNCMGIINTPNKKQSWNFADVRDLIEDSKVENEIMEKARIKQRVEEEYSKEQIKKAMDRL